MHRRVFACVSVIALLLVGVNTSSASGDENRPGRFPGLPFAECIGFPSNPCDPSNPTKVDDFGWLNAPQTAITGSTATMQWATIPITMTAVATEFGFDFLDGPWDSNQSIDLRIRAFFTSPAGGPNNYGDSALIKVRTVVFGAIPAEIVLQVSQERDDRDLPKPLQFVNRTRAINGPQDRPGVNSIYSIEESPEPLRAKVEVRVIDLVLDGVDVGIGPGCSTGPNAALNLDYPTFTYERTTSGEDDPMFDVTHPDDYFYGAAGGSLFGTIDIPAFSGCATGTGDDISQIVTAATSSNGNPVHAKVGLAGCITVADDGRYRPNPPGVMSPFDPRAGCQVDRVNGNYPAVPTPLDFPDYAPGDAAP